MEYSRLFSRGFYWRIALASSLVTGLALGVTNYFRLGELSQSFWLELAFGTVFTGILWWYNLLIYPMLERRLFAHWTFGERQMPRLFSTLLFSFGVVWLDERLQFLQINRNLDGYVYPEYANEVRALLLAGIVLLLVFLLETARRFSRARLENEHLKLENSVAQFEMLKQQINPHFLFNSLNILKTLVKNQDAGAEEYVVRLSELYRGLLLSSRREKVPLAEELTALDHYLFMLKARFEDKLVVSLRLAGLDGACFVPPFTLQMLVENCIKHNTVSAAQPLHIEIFSEKDALVVRNNLQPKRSVEDSHHVGLDNINQRYRLLTGRDIEIEKTAGYFTVRLPIILG